MPDLPTEPIAALQNIKGIDFPSDVRYRQILVTGPPGAGKSTLITRLGGWSEEGYLDLAKKNWWRSEILSVRPREIHLGMPFQGLGDAVTVFDAEFYGRDPIPAIDFDRIQLPPRKRFFLNVDWYRRYAFEFLLPPAEVVFQRRAERAQHSTHVVDKQLSREICTVQHEAFLRLAEHLHRKGFRVYLRELIENPPRRFVDPQAAGAAMNLIAKRRPVTVSRLLAPLKQFLARLGVGTGHEIRLRSNYRLGDAKVRVSFDRVPIEITLGRDDKKLHLYPETRIDERGKPNSTGNFVIVDPAAQPGRINGFLRLTPKSWISLGAGDRVQQALFNYPDAVDDEHLVIIHGPESLVFHNLSDAGATIGRFASDARGMREGSYRRLREIFGGAIEQLPADEALALIEEVNKVMRQEAYRPRSDWGLPGGLVMLPGRLTPILVADLHAQVDNLLTVLSQNAFLDALEDGSAALIILGDAVHCEEDGKLGEMDSSMLMMDLIFRLKLRFPQQVFYIRGNHDSFTEDIAKDGVPQGLLWARELVARRGQAYREAMAEFYRLLPFVVASTDFVACHAAAPKEDVSKDMLVNIHRHPELAIEMVNNRHFQPSRPNGYTRADVKRFRRALGLQKHTTFIVGHTPMDSDSTLWLNVNGIKSHHVLYSARVGQVAMFTRIGGVMVPLIYPVDAVTSLIKQLKDKPA